MKKFKEKLKYVALAVPVAVMASPSFAAIDLTSFETATKADIQTAGTTALGLFGVFIAFLYVFSLLKKGR